MVQLTMQPEKAAQRALANYYDNLPATFPVDPVAVARSLGVNVYSSELELAISGVIARTEKGGETNIFLNSNDSSIRQRFTCAHELGHFFAEEYSENEPGRPFYKERSQLAACGTDSEEMFANQFAAELLMPESEVVRLHALGERAFELSNRFRVSFESATYRLINLKLQR